MLAVFIRWQRECVESMRVPRWFPGHRNPYGQKIRTARQVGQFMPLSVGSPRVVRYVFGVINGGHCEPAGHMGELMEWARILERFLLDVNRNCHGGFPRS